MKLNLIHLPLLLCVIHKISGSLHLSRTMSLWLSAHRMLVYSIRASQCSVATSDVFKVWWDFFNDSCIENFLQSVSERILKIR